MEGKTVIVTGANAGIGKEAAKKLAKMGARVIMACRNLQTGEEAKSDIIKSTENNNIILMKIDLSSFDSVREFVKKIKATESKLDVLIHNAGIWLSQNETNSDGLEMTMATNHFGPFLLTHLLIDLLKKSAPSRIVIVSSVSHHLGGLKFDDLKYVESYFPQWNYFNSKLANICFMRELARRLEGNKVRVNCVHPGLIQTAIWEAVPTFLSFPLSVINKLFFKTTEEGCETLVYLASSNEVEGVTGKYFVDSKIAYMSHKGRNLERNQRLWDISKTIVGLKEEDLKM